MTMLFPEGASCLASVPPPAPLPIMMTSKCLSIRLETDAALHSAAVHEYGRCGDVARTVSREKADHAGDLFRPRHAPQWYGSVELRELGRVVHRAQIDRGCHRAGADADHQNIVARELDSGGARE